MNPRRQRFLPKPEQPPEGMIFNPCPWIWKGRKFIEAWELQETCIGAMQNYDDDARGKPSLVSQMGISELHKYAMLAYNYDPSYNWRKKRGRRS